MAEQNDISSLKLEFQTLLQNLEVRELAINDKITRQLKGLEEQLTTALTQGLPKIFATSFGEAIPKIITALNIVNEEKLKILNDCYTENIKQQIQDIGEAKVKIKHFTSDLDTLDKKRIKRFFLGIIISVIISSIASIGAASYMMKQFPTRVVINNPENIILQDSDVSLWGTENTKFLRKAKK